MYPYMPLLLAAVLLSACKGNGQQTDTMAANPAVLKEKITAQIGLQLEKAVADSGRTGDSLVRLFRPEIASAFYKEKSNATFWSNGQSWHPFADSLFRMVKEARLWGLYPEDYHARALALVYDTIRADTAAKEARMDARWWSVAELLLTDAFVRVVKDIKLGRLPQDSISLRKDSVLPDAFYLEKLAEMEKRGLAAILQSLEPGAKGYHLLKAAIPDFLNRADYKMYTKIPYPEKDSRRFNQFLQKRLAEEGLITDSIAVDSLQLANAVKTYQKKRGITVDGKAGEGTVRMLNTDDNERFARIAISLDKYKQLPAKMPVRYIWVNTSANYLEVVDGNEVKMSSKVICGKPKTRTPLLTSAISSIITYPQWVPPQSIIEKEILPAVKRNPGYLARKGFSLVDKEGNEVDPYSVDWSKYSRSMPYRVVQGSGDANALGIMKFMFDNKYAVYLHDTNQRYLFANAMRSLSHGCVRVQEWDKLAWYILGTDSSLQAGKSVVKTDSVRYWLRNKQKRTIPVRNKMPVFIRYFTCEGQKGRVIFHDDVYGEDKFLRQRYFAGK